MVPPAPSEARRPGAHGNASCKALVAASCAISLGVYLLYRPALRRLVVPQHMRQSAYFEEELLSPQTASALVKLLKRMKTFPTNINDVQFYATEHEHIGEGTPLGSDGKCSDPFKVPNANRSLCVLAGRIDVGRHYVLTGGLQGAREPFEWLVSRVQSFGRYMFDLREYPEVAHLFAEQRFVTLARRVCPEHKQVLDPFQFNFIVQVPGQTVAAHLDGRTFGGRLASNSLSGSWRR